jgi:hypothetical protein
VADQVDHGLKGAERTAAPVLHDVTERAMLDLVPLAGTQGEVRDMDRQTQRVPAVSDRGRFGRRPKRRVRSSSNGDMTTNFPTMVASTSVLRFTVQV